MLCHWRTLCSLCGENYTEKINSVSYAMIQSQIVWTMFSRVSYGKHCFNRSMVRQELHTHIINSSSFGFSRQSSPQRIFDLHLFLSSASSSVTSATAISSLTASIYLLLGLFLWQFHPQHPSPNISIIFLPTCLNHLSLASRVFSPNRPTCAVPLMYSFLILSIPVTPNENCNILNTLLMFSYYCVCSAQLRTFALFQESSSTTWTAH